LATILAATVPWAPTEPSTSVDGTNLKIQWLVPANTGGFGVPVLDFKVEILLTSGTFVAACEVPTTFCLISMYDFVSPVKYNFPQG
jgi:hypothetical protein